MALNIAQATAWAMRGLAFAGGDRRGAISRKYAITSTLTVVQLPRDAEGNLPSLMRFALPAGALLYAAVGADTVAVPTTSANGDGQVVDGDVLSPWGADRIALIAEANATITISYLWA
jgi:hypothetical protein